MRLAEFLKLKGWTEAGLARELGVTRAAVCYWLQGKRLPRPELLAKIERLSGGAVGYYDFVGGKK